MDPLDKLSTPATPPLTASQQDALKKLHGAATQLEGVFVGMLFKAMRDNESQDTIYGKVSNAETTWNEMLDQKRADVMAQTGQLGIAKLIEGQLRASTLASAAAQAPPPGTVPPAAAAGPAAAGTVPPASPAAPKRAPATGQSEELP